MLPKVLASFVRVSPGSSFLSLLLTQSVVGEFSFPPGSSPIAGFFGCSAVAGYMSG